MARSDGFWAAIEAQCAELRTAKTADDVLRILGHDRTPGGAMGSGDGFFAGSGGDDSVAGALQDAGWRMAWYEAHYYYVMEAPNGNKITYCEGDIYRGDVASTSVTPHPADRDQPH